MEQIKYFTKEQLISLNAKARARKSKYLRNLEALDPDHKYPIAQSMLHNDHEVRVFVVLNGKGKTGILDVDLETYHKLPTFILPSIH